VLKKIVTTYTKHQTRCMCNTQARTHARTTHTLLTYIYKTIHVCMSFPRPDVNAITNIHRTTFGVNHI